MSSGSVWDEVLDTEHAVVVRTYIERVPRKDRPPEKVLIIVVGPDRGHRCLCPRCGRCCRPVEADVRRWRTLDVHGKRCFLESELPRVDCPGHGKITAAVPWARHDDRFSAPSGAHAARLAAHVAWTRASAELRITWEALANIVARAAADAAAGLDRLAGLAMIGIGGKSWGKGEGKYLTFVTGHVRHKIAWMAGGRSQDTVRAFFAALGPDRAKQLTHVSADGAEWIHDVIREKAPQAKICLDAFHVVKWAGERLDELRRRRAGELRAAGHEDQAATLGTGLRALRKTSVDEFVQQASGSTVRVRSPEAAELRSLIAGPEVTVTGEETGVLTVSGLTSEQIGIAAAEHGVTLFELAPQQASLEDAFMELTQDALEYKAQDPASTIVAGAGQKAS